MASFGTGNASEASPSSLGPPRFGAESRRNSTVKGTRKKSGRCSRRIAERRSGEREGGLRAAFVLFAYSACAGVLRDPRQPMSPSPANPSAIIAQVEDSGTGTMAVRETSASSTNAGSVNWISFPNAVGEICRTLLD
jgi:hypothetical protein